MTKSVSVKNQVKSIFLSSCIAVACSHANAAVSDAPPSSYKVPLGASGSMSEPDLIAPKVSPGGDRRSTRVADSEEAPVTAGNQAVYPLSWTGKYIRPIGTDRIGMCTAQFIADRIILLAAHCVKNQSTGEKYPYGRFLLQYQNHDFSKEYHVVCVGVYNEWVVPLRPGEDPHNPSTMSSDRQTEYYNAIDHAWQFDFALILLDGDSLHGHYGVAINHQFKTAVTTGYPARLMGGEVIQAIRGDVFLASTLDSQDNEPNEQVIWDGNKDFTEGASGGAWVANYSGDVKAGNNQIIGLNSYSSSLRPGAEFGPKFTDNFNVLFKYVQQGCKQSAN